MKRLDSTVSAPLNLALSVEAKTETTTPDDVQSLLSELTVAEKISLVLGVTIAFGE